MAAYVRELDLSYWVAVRSGRRAGFGVQVLGRVKKLAFVVGVGGWVDLLLGGGQVW